MYHLARRHLCSLVVFYALALPLSAQVRISQVYGGGQAAASVYKNDYVELFNAGASSVSLSGWALQYQSATGTGNWSGRVNLSGTIGAGKYFLVQMSASTGSGAAALDLPTPDLVSTSVSLSATAGKVALTSDTVTLVTAAGPPVGCPTGVAIVDFVGYGTTANCSETAPTPAPATITGLFRAADGCTDSNSNMADFTVAAPLPRNSASAALLCAGGPAPILLTVNDVSGTEGNSGTVNATFTVRLSAAAPAGGVSFDIATADGTATVANADYVARGLTAQTIAAGATTFSFAVVVNGDLAVEPNETLFVNVTNVVGATVLDAQGIGTILNDDFLLTSINQLQGSGLVSPLPIGTTVSVQGIVTAVSVNGYFFQTPDEQVDSDPNTSEGLFVFTNTVPTVSAGQLVTSTGTVTEFRPGVDPNSRSITQITQTSVVVISSGNPLPAPVLLPAPTANGGVDQLERFEGMRVQVAALRSVTPTDGNINEATAVASSNGVLYAVFPGVALPFREAGIDVLDFPANPATACAAGSGCALPLFDANPERLRLDTDAVSSQTPLNVNTGTTLSNVVGVLHYAFRAYTILTTQPPTVSGTSVSLTPLPAPPANTVSIASLNVERLFDTVDDPGVGDVVVQVTAFNGRLSKLSQTLRNVLGTPDVVALEEVENLNAAQALATRINNDAVTASQPNPGYTAFLVEGNDVGGIDVAFLVRSSVTVASVVQLGATLTFTSPCTGAPEILNDRPPLRLRGTSTKGGQTLDFTVFVNHLRSLNGIADTTPCAFSTDGARVRAKRAAQADYVAQVIQEELTANPAAKIIAVGDFNAFEVNDGYGDSVNAILGAPAPPHPSARGQCGPLLRQSHEPRLASAPRAAVLLHLRRQSPNPGSRHAESRRPGAIRRWRLRARQCRLPRAPPRRVQPARALLRSRPPRRPPHHRVQRYRSTRRRQDAPSLQSGHRPLEQHRPPDQPHRRHAPRSALVGHHRSHARRLPYQRRLLHSRCHPIQRPRSARPGPDR